MTGGATIAKNFLAFLQTVDGDTREKEWVLAASAYLVGNKIIQELDLVGLSFEGLDGLEAADAGQKSWLKRCSVSEYRLFCLE